jgi:hypothetical protein
MTSKNSPTTRDEYAPLRIIAFVLMASLLVFLAIVVSLHPEGGGSEHVGPIYVMAAMAWVIAWKLPDYFIKVNKRSLADAEPGSESGPNPRWFAFVPWITRMALFEAVALYGVVLGITASITHLWALWAVGFFSQLSQFPSEERFRDWIRRS